MRKFKRYSYCVLISILYLALISGKSQDILAPDGNLLLRTFVKHGGVFFSIIDRQGNVLYSTNTEASDFHKWSFTWLNNTKILFESSDCGDWYWIQQQSGSWKRVSPLKKLSPDGTLVVYTSWNSYKDEENALTISFLQADGDIDKATTVLHEISTKIIVPNLRDCARWEDNNTVVITTQEQEYIWQKQPDRSWKLINGAQELIISHRSFLSDQDPEDKQETQK